MFQMHFCGIASAERGSTHCRKGILLIPECEALLLPWLCSLMVWHCRVLTVRVAGQDTEDCCQHPFLSKM